MTNPNHKAADESELMQAWSAGDREAGAILFDRHFPVVYRFFLSKAEHVAEDLAQRTFVACQGSAHRFDPTRASLRAFLIGIARHELLHYLRRHGRHRSMLRHLPGATVRNTSPRQVRARDRLLLEALRSVSMPHQIVLELRYWEGWGVAEIAAALEVPEGTVKSRLSRAQQRLRARLQRLAKGAEELQSTGDDLALWALRVRAQLS